MERVITAVDGFGRSFQTTCRVTTRPERGYRLELSAPEIGNHVGEAGDAFECLSIVRRRLEQTHIRLCCNGARRDVWPSGMARDMGGGFKAYFLTMGKPSQISDLVDIFEPAPVKAIGSVEEQREFAQRWIAKQRS
jgi:hypothetical protein